MKTPNLDVDAFVEALRGDLPSAADEARVRARLLGAGVVVGGAALSTSSGAASLAGSTSGAAAAVPGAALTQGAALSKAALTNAALSNAALSKAVSGAGVGAGGLGAGVTAGGIGAAGAPAAVLKAGLLSKIVVLPVAAKVGVATTLALAVAATSVPLLSHDQPTANRPAAAPNAPAAARSAPEPKSVVSGALPNTRRSLSASSPAQDVAAEDVAAQDIAAPDSNARASRVARSDGAIAAPPAVSATEAQQMAAAPSDLTAQRPERDVVASDAAAPRARSRSANTRTRSSARSGTSKTRGGAEGARDHEPVAASAYEPSSASAPEPAAGETASASDSTLASGRTEWVRASQLAEETRLIEQALVALGDGDPSLARRSLEEHARRFPDGLLTRERERARARVRELDAHRR